jgi:hypothetical protein
VFNLSTWPQWLLLTFLVYVLTDLIKADIDCLSRPMSETVTAIVAQTAVMAGAAYTLIAAGAFRAWGLG